MTEQIETIEQEDLEAAVIASTQADNISVWICASSRV